MLRHGREGRRNRRGLPVTVFHKIISDQAYSAYQNQLEREVRSQPLPQHIAIIMDGNRRFAREMGESPEEGHRRGRDKLEEVLHWCLDLGIKDLTVYAFSTENFRREESEVDYLMELLETTLYDFADDPRIHENEVKLRVIGDLDMVPEGIQEAADYALKKTEGYGKHSLNLAIAYGGRQDITNAVRSLAQDVLDGKIAVDDINEAMVSSRISTNGLPDPDLVLRTSGELRISNFLLWQMAYSELYFTDVYWPGFRYIDLLRAIRNYQNRKRRYGERPCSTTSSSSMRPASTISGRSPSSTAQ
ncbi:MAG: di-trans,poly-cis-decaprenylcistransferase [Candidatus Methanomethylophilaceae archaeon]|nr:di-trans,poly-cis-decaprenylcistransferase [Candidatus Methanomethylophilaceae archaeon]